MRSCCPAIAAAASSLLLAAATCLAGDAPDNAPHQLATNFLRQNDGWRPVRRVAAQSPDEEPPTSLRSQQPFVPTRPTTTVPVPAYRGSPDVLARQAEPARQIALVPQRRSAVASPRRPVPLYEATPPEYPQDDLPPESAPALPRYRPRPRSAAPQEDEPPVSYGRQSSPPPLPRFHESPFERPGTRSAPAQPANPYSNAPCRPPGPFDDSCAVPLDSPCKYTWDNVYYFSLADLFRLSDQHTRLAWRSGVNWGLPVFEDDFGLGFQIGYSGSIAEEGPQQFLTGGLFYRGDMSYQAAWNVGAVIDWMQDNEFDADVAQIRAKTSVTLSRRNEIGIWGAASVWDDKKRNGETAQTVDQANLFYRHLFESGWDVTGTVGLRSDPGSFALGGSAYVPIDDFWAWSFGGYYAPNGDSWNAYAGMVRHWGARARQDYIGQDRHQPYSPVADNGSMTLFVHR